MNTHAHSSLFMRGESRNSQRSVTDEMVLRPVNKKAAKLGDEIGACYVAHSHMQWADSLHLHQYRFHFFLSVLNDSHLEACVISHCGFYLHPPLVRNVKHVFMSLLTICIIFC